MNLDGSLFGPVTSQGVNCPIMFFAHVGKNLTTDTSWEQFWRHTMHTTKVELELEGSAKGNFTDFPSLAETIGVPGQVAEKLVDLIVVYLVRESTAF